MDSKTLDDNFFKIIQFLTRYDDYKDVHHNFDGKMDKSLMITFTTYNIDINEFTSKIAQLCGITPNQYRLWITARSYDIGHSEALNIKMIFNKDD